MKSLLLLRLELVCNAVEGQFFGCRVADDGCRVVFHHLGLRLVQLHFVVVLNNFGNQTLGPFDRAFVVAVVSVVLDSVPGHQLVHLLF